MPEYTPTEQRIINLLSDGQAHPKKELFACLEDDQAGPTAVGFHICMLRRKLRPIGQDILCEWDRRRGVYRHVRLLVKQ